VVRVQPGLPRQTRPVPARKSRFFMTFEKPRHRLLPKRDIKEALNEMQALAFRGICGEILAGREIQKFDMYLFGSISRGTFDDDSDIDVLLVLEGDQKTSSGVQEISPRLQFWLVVELTRVRPKIEEELGRSVEIAFATYDDLEIARESLRDGMWNHLTRIYRDLKPLTDKDSREFIAL